MCLKFKFDGKCIWWHFQTENIRISMDGLNLCYNENSLFVTLLQTDIPNNGAAFSTRC